MKKIILVICFLIIVSGCESKTEEFTKVCKEKIESINIIDITSKKITFNNLDKVTKVVITKTYKAKDAEGKIVIDGIIKSAKNYNNNLAKSKNIKIKNIINDSDMYKVRYYLDVQNLTDDELSEFNLKKNSIKFFHKMRQENIICQ